MFVELVEGILVQLCQMLIGTLMLYPLILILDFQKNISHLNIILSVSYEGSRSLVGTYV